MALAICDCKLLVSAKTAGHPCMMTFRRVKGALLGMFRKLRHWIGNRNAISVAVVLIFIPTALMGLRGFLLSGHGCALQNNAVTNMRSLRTAVITYESTYKAYPSSLAVLGPPAMGLSTSAEAAGLIDRRLASGNYINYQFRYSLNGPLYQGDMPGYVIVADPIVDGLERRHYYTREDAIIRSEKGRPATPESPESHEDGCICW